MFVIWLLGTKRSPGRRCRHFETGRVKMGIDRQDKGQDKEARDKQDNEAGNKQDKKAGNKRDKEAGDKQDKEVGNRYFRGSCNTYI
jgi:hypothetical protein